MSTCFEVQARRHIHVQKLKLKPVLKLRDVNREGVWPAHTMATKNQAHALLPRESVNANAAENAKGRMV